MPSPFPNLPPYLRGHVAHLDHDSRLLADNPWGDPSHRELWVYLPPGQAHAATPLPGVLLLPGYGATGEGMLARGLTEVSMASRLDRLVVEEGCPPFIAVLPDCMTSLGGSQFVDSPAVGAYASWLVEELMPFVEGRFSTTGRWGVAGRSSGGFGALHLAMSFPGRFQAVACHSGDMGFDLCWLADLQRAVAGVQAAGGLAEYLAHCWEPERWSADHFSALMILAMSCCYSPDLQAEGPLPARLPVDFRTGAVDFEVLQSWSAFDPVRRAAEPAAQEALRRLALLYIDAGNRDKYLLHLGARRLVAELSAAGVPHRYEEYAGGHRGTSYRWDHSLPLLAAALTAPAGALAAPAGAPAAPAAGG